MQSLLSHIRILDLTRVLAGPWATQILADLGADVIKIEKPGQGDDTRSWGPPFLKTKDSETQGDGGYFVTANRGKRSIAIDLKTKQGQEVVKALAAESDVLVENFKVGTLERLGLGYEELTEINPALIYCSITGFGQTGPRAEQPAYDFLIQALSGLMSITGESDDKPGGGPQKVGVPIVDLGTGVYAALAITAALVGRSQTGYGEYIDLSMMDVQVGLLANQAMNYLLTGNVPQRTGTAHPNIQPQRIFDCADGQMIIVIGNDRQFRLFCDVLGLSKLKNDTRFSTNGNRVKNKTILDELINPILKGKSREHWLNKLLLAGVPAGPINNIAEVFADAQVQHRELLRSYAHPYYGDIPQVVSPFRFKKAQAYSSLPPPMIGQHTKMILEELGMSSVEIQKLKDAGIV